MLKKVTLSYVCENINVIYKFHLPTQDLHIPINNKRDVNGINILRIACGSLVLIFFNLFVVIIIIIIIFFLISWVFSVAFFHEVKYLTVVVCVAVLLFVGLKVYIRKVSPTW